jgi:two-component system response regulator
MNHDHAVEVLLVEDNPADVDLAMHALARGNLADDVHVVRDGAEALEFIFCTDRYAGRRIVDQPKVVLLDLKLPLVDGIDVLRELKGDPRTSRTPVVMLTSSAEDRDLAAAYDLGVNSYVVKPVDIDQFFDAIQRLGSYWTALNRPERHPRAARL